MIWLRQSLGVWPLHFFCHFRHARMKKPRKMQFHSLCLNACTECSIQSATLSLVRHGCRISEDYYQSATKKSKAATSRLHPKRDRAPDQRCDQSSLHTVQTVRHSAARRHLWYACVRCARLALLILSPRRQGTHDTVSQVREHLWKHSALLARSGAAFPSRRKRGASWSNFDCLTTKLCARGCL